MNNKIIEIEREMTPILDEAMRAHWAYYMGRINKEQLDALVINLQAEIKRIIGQRTSCITQSS